MYNINTSITANKNRPLIYYNTKKEKGNKIIKERGINQLLNKLKPVFESGL